MPLAAGGAFAATDLDGGGGEKREGWPVCLFQASQIRNSDIENTTHRIVRRVSFMGGAFFGYTRQGIR